MYEYKYVPCNIGGLFSKDNHRELISEYARQGWRVVQILPLYYTFEGRAKDHEIIFEREIKDK